jgi:hypothetical protein
MVLSGAEMGHSESDLEKRLSRVAQQQQGQQQQRWLVLVGRKERE